MYVHFHFFKKYNLNLFINTIIKQVLKHETARRNTYRKGKEGLREKIEELCILCDIKGCMHMYNAEIGGE